MRKRLCPGGLLVYRTVYISDRRLSWLVVLANAAILRVHVFVDALLARVFSCGTLTIISPKKLSLTVLSRGFSLRYRPCDDAPIALLDQARLR